ncbi:MAG: lysophospholipid acyltransferase family protein [Chthoniobacterales bacterium]
MAPGSGALTHGAESAGPADLGVRNRWKELRYRFEWFAVWLLTKIVPLLPRLAAYCAAQFFGALAAHLDRHGRKVALANLASAFGDQMSLQARKRIVRESYQHFARTMIDLFWSPRLTEKNFQRWIEFDYAEWARVGIAPGDSFVLGTYHYGNFEWFSLASGFLRFNGTIITQEFKNALLDPIFKNLRELSGHQMVAREGGVVRLYKNVRRGSIAAILIDLTIPAKTPSVAINCFGLKTNVTYAHAWLHKKTGKPLITAHAEPLPRGRYRMVLHRPEFSSDASLQQIAQACWDAFEPHVRANPAPWLWMYKHWRYRPGSEPREQYPFYANFSEDFEVRLEESGFPSVLPENAATVANGIIDK